MPFCESQMSSSVYFLSFLVVHTCTAGKPVRGYAEDLGAEKITELIFVIFLLLNISGRDLTGLANGWSRRSLILSRRSSKRSTVRDAGAFLPSFDALLRIFRRGRGGEFSEARVISEGIEHWIEPQ
jgi:hypothetical protein